MDTFIQSLNTEYQFSHQFFCSLAVLGLSCSMRDLPSLLWHSRCLAVARGIQFPDHGLNPGPLHWERRVLATEPPEKSLSDQFSNANSMQEESILSSFLYLTKNQHSTPVTFRRKQDIGSWTGRKGNARVAVMEKKKRKKKRRGGRGQVRWNGKSKTQKWRCNGAFCEQHILYGLQFAGSKCLENEMVGKQSSYGRQ